ncbi:MAG: cobalt chelatase [Gammaproteobacteria bacterium]
MRSTIKDAAAAKKGSNTQVGWNKKRESLESANSALAKTLTQDPNLKINRVLHNHLPIQGSIALTSPPRNQNKLAAWRGSIDQQVFWQLKHKNLENPKLTREAQQLFESLEIARVDILASREYQGMKENIAEYCNQELNENTSISAIQNIPLVLRYKSGIKIDGLKNNDELKMFDSAFDRLLACCEDQILFQKHVLEIIDLLGLNTFSGEEDNSEKSEEMLKDDQLQEEKNEELSSPSELPIDIQKDGDANSETTESDVVEQVEIEASSENPTDSFNSLQLSTKQTHPYEVFTKKFDEIISAKELATNEEIIRLREQLDQLVKPHENTIGKMANRLQRILQAKQQRSWNFNLEEGMLDTARLTRIIANPLFAQSYKQEKEINFEDTVISLLIDCSGSMRGRSISLAAVCVDIIGATLARCSIKTELLGFTTKHWKGGEARKLWTSQGSPSNPGRLNDLRHIIFKAADENFRISKRNLGVMLREGLLKENIDGEALYWSQERLLRRPERRKIMIVISDGAPVDDSSLSANNSGFLDHHLKSVIHEIETRNQIELLAIGIGHDVTKYYERSITIHRADELGETLLEQLIVLFA